MDSIADEGGQNGNGKGRMEATGGADCEVNTDSVRRKLSVQRTGSVSG
jgi:hypothetical protein